MKTLIAMLLLMACMADAGERHRAIVCRVYDGDTCTVLIYQSPGDWSQIERIRLKDLWAPEIKGKERAAGLVAKAKLSHLILGKEVVIIDSGDRSFGRWVGDVELNGTNVTQLIKGLE